MCVPVPWFAYVMNATMALTRDAVSSVEGPESLMPIIVRSAPSRRRIEMDAQRLSIWGALRQISSMNAKNMASRRGDWWVAPPSPITLLQLPEKTPPTTSRREQSPEHHQNRLPSAGTLPPFFCPRPDMVEMDKDAALSTWADWIRS